MRTVQHIFRTPEEATAFEIGVEWVNDSAIEIVNVITGNIESYGDCTIVICEDDDGDEEDNLTFDHRK
jgi:hypothetical protein